jgi:hypothetical protein
MRVPLYLDKLRVAVASNTLASKLTSLFMILQSCDLADHSIDIDYSRGMKSEYDFHFALLAVSGARLVLAVWSRVILWPGLGVVLGFVIRSLTFSGLLERGIMSGLGMVGFIRDITESVRLERGAPVRRRSCSLSRRSLRYTDGRL